MWSRLFSCLCLLLLLGFSIHILHPLIWPACPVQSLEDCVLICTVCSEGSSVPSAPVTFAARFSGAKFVTASAPLCLNEPPPPPQTGTYRFTPASGRCGGATLKMRQPSKNVHSTLKLRFTHASGGSMTGKMTQDGECVAEQIGMFQICGSDHLPTRSQLGFW